MQVTETLSEGLKRGFTVVVPSNDIEGKRSAKLAELSKQIRLPGFRPGKVPERIVRQRYGTAVMAEVLEDSVNEATQQVLSDRGLRAATQPKVDVKAVGAGLEAPQDLEFTVEVELLPEITPPDFTSLSLTRLKAEPSAAEIDTSLANLAQRQRSLDPVDPPRPAIKGDFLTVDYTGRIDGVPFPGGAGTDVDIEVGGSGFIPGFTEQLEGAQPGETRSVDVTFPENYATADLAGKAAQFEIAVKALKVATIPAIDDALAEKIGFDTLDELRGALTRQMQREFDGMSRMRIKRDLLDRLSKLTDFAVPPSMADAEFEQIWQRLEADRKAGQEDAEDKGKDEDTLRAEYRAIAERRVRLGLLLAEVGRSQGVTVSAEEMTQAMRAEAMKYPQQAAQVMEFFRKTPEAAERLRGPIFEDKVVDYILDQATVEERVVSADDLAAEPAELPAADAAPAESAPAESAAAEPAAGDAPAA